MIAGPNSEVPVARPGAAEQSTGGGPPVNEAQIRAKIKEILKAIEGEDELFRGLCRLAETWNVDPEGFRGLLKKAGLRAARASEIKAVLLRPEVLEKFLAGHPWKETLVKARLDSLQGLSLHARALVRKLEAIGQKWPSGHQHDNKWVLERDSDGSVRLSCPTEGTMEVVTVRFPFPQIPQ